MYCAVYQYYMKFGTDFEFKGETIIVLPGMKKIIFTLLLIAGVGIVVSGQEKWSLEKCISYAIENNIALKRQQVQTEQNRTNLKQSRAALLPNLNFQSSGAMNFGRSVDPVTNTITFNQNIQNSYFMGSNITVFNGFALANRISASKFMYEMGLELEQANKDLLTVDITNAYFQVLMYRGVVSTARKQLEVSEQQLHRISVMVETGAESKTTKLEIQSQVSNDRLLLTQAINNEMIALESLKQLLQLDSSTDFNISEESLLVNVGEDMTTDVDSVFNTAKEILPGINALVLQAEARKKLVKAAIGEATPELTFSGGWRTGYYDAMMEGVATTPFPEQLKNNNNQSLSATITIPIFNRWYSGSNIKRAKLNLQDAELQLQQEYNTLYSQVTNATLELEAAKDEHMAIKDSKEYSDLAFTAVEKKFQTGMANATEFAEARRQKFYAEVNLLRVQLQYNLKMMMLKYYLTGQWSL